MGAQETQGSFWKRPGRSRGGGGILEFRGSFLEGAGLATKHSLPWRVTSQLSGKNSCVVSFKEVGPRPVEADGDSSPRQALQLGWGGFLLPAAGWLCGLGPVTAPL